MKPTDQLMLSIGALLAAERQKRGIAVEKAAKETRMRPARIRDMENDDLSHFTNPSYARMFIIAYAKYLDIPMQTIRDYLPDRGESGSEDYHYIAAAAGHELPSLRRDLVSRPLRRSAWVPIVGIAVFVCLIGLIGGGAYIYVNVNRITAAVDKPPAPAPTPTIVYVQPPVIPEVHLSNLTADGEKAPWLESNATIAAPPTPVPASVVVDKPAPAPQAVAAPAPPAPAQAPIPLESDDRAFLLGSSPDQRPSATVR